MSRSECGRPRKPVRRGRPGKYQDQEFKNALRRCWRELNYICGRRAKAALPDWLGFIEEEYGAFSGDVRERLLTISAATIDRLLKPYKGQKGKSLTRNCGFREEIPIQENIWDIQCPGFMEADTVAHCGGSTFGEYINTLNMVDIYTLWTEPRAVFGKGSNAVFDALIDIEANLPFPILGYDADNGGEVLNKHLYSYFRDERTQLGRPPVQVTRSREYKKNDQAHIEQRNDSVPRHYLGYERLDFAELIPLVNYYYAKVVSPLMNHFMPTFKLKNKIRVKSRTRRIYDKPVTPFSRVMLSEHVHKDLKDKLKEEHERLNPVKLRKEEIAIRKLIDTALKRLKAGQGMPPHPTYTLIGPFLTAEKQSTDTQPPIVLHSRVLPKNAWR